MSLLVSLGSTVFDESRSDIRCTMLVSELRVLVGVVLHCNAFTCM